MNYRLGRWLIASVLLWSARAGDAGVAGRPVAGPERQLLDLTRQLAEAETRRDELTLRRILDDRILATFGTGQPIGKEAYVKAIMTEGEHKMLGQDLTDETVVVDGTTGVVVGTVAIRSLVHGQESTSTYRYTAIYIKRDDWWTMLSLHMVKMGPKK